MYSDSYVTSFLEGGGFNTTDLLKLYVVGGTKKFLRSQALNFLRFETVNEENSLKTVKNNIKS